MDPGYPREGRDWLERTLALAGSIDMAGRAAAEFALGHLSLDMADYEAAAAHLQQSLEAHRQLGDAQGEVEVLSALAMIALNRHAFNEARGLGEDALKIARDNGDRRSSPPHSAAWAWLRGSKASTSRLSDLLEESMALGRALGDLAWTARVSTQIGITHRLAGNAEQAQHFLDASRELSTELGDRFALAVIANNSGHLAFDAG